jgi:hypothetical protein
MKLAMWNIVTCRRIARRRLGDHIPVTTNTQATIGYLSFLCSRAVNTTIEEAMNSIWFAYIHCWATDVFFVMSDPSLYNEKPTIIDSWSPCGGGIEYLHRDPASRRRRRKGKSQMWDSKIWSRYPRDSDQRKIALARASSIYKSQTRPLVREGAPQEQDRNCHTNNKDLVVSPKRVLYTKTDWPADRRSYCKTQHNWQLSWVEDCAVEC